jgi:hypothetical protein
VWSDVDVVVAAEPEAVPAIADDTVVALGMPGTVLFRLAVPRNAPAGGAYLGVCLELAGLPLWTDWYVWPTTTAAVPADAVVVVARAGVPLPRSAQRFMPLLDRKRTTATGKADRADPRFRLLAVMLAAKYLARRDADRLAHMLRLLALDPVDAAHAPVLLHSVLTPVGGAELRPAVTAATALLELATGLGVSPPDEDPA